MYINETIQQSTNNTEHSKYKYTYVLPKHPHSAKQVKTTTVQDTPKWNSHNTIKYPQYKVTLMCMVLLYFNFSHYRIERT
jgi:hypothetical protein